METNQTQGAILRLPAPGASSIEVRELATPGGGAPAAKQKWDIGETVRIGSLLLRVQEHLPPARKGEARRVRLVAHDLSRQYIWTPFRGLKVIGGAPKRRRRRAKAGSSRPAVVQKAAPAAPRARIQTARLGLLSRVWKSLTAH